MHLSPDAVDVLIPPRTQTCDLHNATIVPGILIQEPVSLIELACAHHMNPSSVKIFRMRRRIMEFRLISTFRAEERASAHISGVAFTLT